jgi:protein gp37
MASKIEWTGKTWNPFVGCSLKSPGCTHCYAMKQAARIQRMTPGSHYIGTTRDVKGVPVWTGIINRAPEHIRLAPLHRKTPTTWFINSMSDLFHEDVPDEWRDEVFAVMALCPQHTFQILTKRSKVMREYLQGDYGMRLGAHLMQAARGTVGAEIAVIDITHRLYVGRQPLANVHLGVSCEDQAHADERIPDLLATPAAVRFVSAEPLLGPIDFRQSFANSLNKIRQGSTISWIIVGGESGKKARPMHPDWARDIRDQCAKAGTAFFFKQWGEFREYYTGPDTIEIDNDSETADAFVADAVRPSWIMKDGQHITKRKTLPYDIPCRLIERVGKKRAGRHLDGVIHDAMPQVAK